MRKGLLVVAVAIWAPIFGTPAGRLHATGPDSSAAIHFSTASRPHPRRELTPMLGFGVPRPQLRMAASAAAASALSASDQRTLLTRYCVTCHNQKLRTGGLALDEMDVANVADRAHVWEKVVRRLRAGVMPPAGLPRPDKATYESLVSSLETALDRAALAHPNPGRTAPFHRLNRTEYHHAIRDLLGLDIDVASLLPPDDSSYGFDNIGDILGVTSTLLEGYLEAARKVSQDALGDVGADQETYTYTVAPDLTQDYRLGDLPFGTRGGTLVRHNFPVDGEYVIAVKLLRNFIGGIMGLAERHQLELTLDGERMQLFTVGGRRQRGGADAENEDQGSRNRELPEDAGLKIRIAVKAGSRAVGATFLQRSAAQVEDLRPPYLRSFAVLSDFANGQPHVGSVAITGPFDAAVRDTPSRQRILTCRPSTPEAESLRSRPTHSEARQASGSREPSRGAKAPSDSAGGGAPTQVSKGGAPREVKDADSCANKILSSLARRAYRRPIGDSDLQPLMAFYESGLKAGGFDAGIQKALQRLLVSPEFLVRVERDRGKGDGNEGYQVSDLELASRLSFFLWSSIPDEELLEQAERGRLRKPEVLLQQVRRMLADRRSQALVTNFAGQWLYLRNVPAAKPDTQLFPDFDENLRLAFRRETELLFETIMREDRSALDLLSARYTFVNERLARHYGIPNVYGSHFRRVSLGEDSVRGGLLGQGSILTVTSYPNRTSPVQRGKWILENIFGSGPPPPPPNVPELEERADDGKILSMRQRMAQHRKNPVCASCHSRMDSLGLALENFDAVGRWRDVSESNDRIDAWGALPDGTPFNGPRELRGALMDNSGTFLTTLTEKLLTYALGRGVEYYDAPTVRAITREAARDGYRFSKIVLGIVNSVPFQMRRPAG